MVTPEQAKKAYKSYQATKKESTPIVSMEDKDFLTQIQTEAIVWFESEKVEEKIDASLCEGFREISFNIPAEYSSHIIDHVRNLYPDWVINFDFNDDGYDYDENDYLSFIFKQSFFGKICDILLRIEEAFRRLFC
jgi:hypothetical protein